VENMKKHFYLIILAVLLALVLFAVSCGSSSNTTTSTTSPTQTSTTSTTTPVNVAVVLESFAFSPDNITVSVGTTVTWTNNDPVTHTVTSNTGLFSSGSLPPGGTFSFTFTQAGTFQYHCSIHTTMHGTVIVL
jgi:plastocyanin